MLMRHAHGLGFEHKSREKKKSLYYMEWENMWLHFQERLLWCTLVCVLSRIKGRAITNSVSDGGAETRECYSKHNQNMLSQDANFNILISTSFLYIYLLLIIKCSSDRAEYKIDWLALNNVIKRKNQKLSVQVQRATTFPLDFSTEICLRQRVLFSVYKNQTKQNKGIMMGILKTCLLFVFIYS